MSINCIYHDDKEAIMECEVCKFPVCIDDSYIFKDVINEEERKFRYCAICFNDYKMEEEKNDAPGGIILITIGIILVIY
jgi:hypothetical protein